MISSIKSALLKAIAVARIQLLKGGELIRTSPVPLAMVIYLCVWIGELRFRLFGLSGLQLAIFRYSCGPISLAYLVYRWKVFLIWIWRSSIGKVVYVICSALIYATSRTLADRVIGETLQTSASHFPNAQNDLTLYYVIFLTFFTVGMCVTLTYYIVLAAAIVASPTVLLGHAILSTFRADSVNPFVRTLAFAVKLDRRAFFAAVDLFASLIAGYFILQIPVLTERPTWIKDELGQYISLPEEILIISSFYPNRTGLDANGENKRICSNLRDDVLVAVSNPDDVVPRDIVVAEVIQKKQKRVIPIFSDSHDVTTRTTRIICGMTSNLGSERCHPCDRRALVQVGQVGHPAPPVPP